MGERRERRIRIPLPSAEFLRNILQYDTSTGLLTWKPRDAHLKRNRIFNSKYAGSLAGFEFTSRNGAGNKYALVSFSIDGQLHRYPAHRVIWKIMTGHEPPDFIDHRDRDGTNNRWENLREATNGKNLQNAKLRSDNKSGVKGVSWDSYHNKWQAVISSQKVHVRIGRFDSIASAETAIIAARLKMHGEFARVK